jgi:hypothetical protein
VRKLSKTWRWCRRLRDTFMRLSLPRARSMLSIEPASRYMLTLLDLKLDSFDSRWRLNTGHKGPWMRPSALRGLRSNLSCLICAELALWRWIMQFQSPPRLSRRVIGLHLAQATQNDGKSITLLLFCHRGLCCRQGRSSLLRSVWWTFAGIRTSAIRS